MSSGLLHIIDRRPNVANVEVGSGVCVKEHRPQNSYGNSGQSSHSDYRLLGASSCMSPPNRTQNGRCSSPFLRFYFSTLPYLLCFIAGIIFTSGIMFHFDNIKPCGKSLSDTLLYVVANVTRTTWDVSKSKYVIQCPDHPPHFQGKLRFPLEKTPTFDEINKLYATAFIKNDPAIGGHFKPDWCKATSRVAVIVPYRNREENLRGFLYYMHQILQRQLLDYAIFVVEQAGPETTRFNRGLLLNVGFNEAMKAYDFDCVIYYDVDKIPEDDRSSHACPRVGQVRHMAAYQHRFERMAFRDDYFGGVLALTSQDIKSINGLSNIFFGYGYEDDEFLQRIKMKNLTIYREHPMLTKYWNLGHEGDGVLFSEFDWKHENEKLLHTTTERMPIDGLNSVSYDSIEILKKPTYTHIVVHFSEKAVLANMLKKNRAMFKLVAGAFNIDADKFENSL